jgi:MinD superfamily P-loop ATPase
VETCFIGAVSLAGGRSRIDPEICKGCGRCAAACPNQAIRVDFDSTGALFRELLSRVGTAIK